METKTHSQKGVPKPAFQPFDKICKAEFKHIIEGLEQIDWPAWNSTIKDYIFLLKTHIKNKDFNKPTAQKFIKRMDLFLSLYKSITGGDLKMTRLPGEVLIHEGVRKLNKAIHRMERDNGHNKVEVGSRKKICP